MTRTHATLLVPLLLAACSTQSTVRIDERARHRSMYPPAPTSDVVDDYHGTEVPDPYRPLEDPDAPATRAWIEAQNALVRAHVDAIPSRGAIEARLTELWDHERYGLPKKAGARWLYTRNDGLQNQPVLHATDDLEARGRVLFDPNALSQDGTLALTAYEPTEDGRLVALMLSEAGSDWNRIRVLEVESGRELEDRVEWVKFSGLSWSRDGAGFYYSTYPDHDTSGRTALKNHELRYHRLGTPQAQDELVYARPDQPEWGFGGTVTDDGTLLVVHVWQGTEPRNRIYVRDLTSPGAAVVPLLDDFDAEYDFVAKYGGDLYFKSDLDAPRGRVLAVPLATPERARWRPIVPEGGATLESAHAAGGKLVLAWLEDAHSKLTVHEPTGELVASPDLPGLGSIAGVESDPDERELFFAWTGFTAPTSVRRYDVATRAGSVWRAPKVPFDPAGFVTEQVFYASRDGTRIPMFLTRRRDVRPSADTPVLLYGYGGFNIAMKPAFSASNLVWIERGGVFAVACLRGGGEYGRAWHEAGTKGSKQNVFDDFVAAAEWLIAEGWTSPSKLAIRGGSNGGLLVGACITQRPELFGAALPAVGVLDMLRFHKFTIGWGWSSDYGNADDAEAFRWLYAYSPLHRIVPGTCYPPTMITTGDHDDRVVPAHSFKFAAALQAAQGCPNPVLIRIETRGGHGAGKPTSMLIEEVADQWAFLERALGLAPQPKAPPAATAAR